MSKKKSKRKKKNITPKPKKKNLKSLIIAACVVAAGTLAILAVYIVYLNTSLEATDFANLTWHSVSAYDASDDEVDIQNVYNNRYDNYRGSLTLNGDGTFSFWMSPGDPSDGTHNGTYTYDREKETLNAKFENGDKTTFKIIRDDDNTINHIEAPYGDYTIWFSLTQ